MALLACFVVYLCVCVLYLPASADSACPANCQCWQKSMSCALGEAGFPQVDNASEVEHFVFRDCTAPLTLSAVPYRSAKSLIVSNCAVTEISDDAFAGLPQLQSLEISANRGLASVPAAAFRNLPSLSSVDLSANGLTVLPDTLFSSLPALVELTLSYNAVHLSGHLLEGAARLRTFTCDGCELTLVPTFALSKLTRLESLELNLNPLNPLHDSAFSGLSTLHRLSLDNCSLSVLIPGAFRGLSSVEELFIGNNELRTLNAATFDDLPRLKVLALEHNALTTLPETLLSSWDGLESLRLADNNWNCDCDSFSMTSLNRSVVVDWQQTRCASPESLAGQSVLEASAQIELACSASSGSSSGRTVSIVVVVAAALILCIIVSLVYCRQRRTKQRSVAQFSYAVLDEPPTAAVTS